MASTLQPRCLLIYSSFYVTSTQKSLFRFSSKLSRRRPPHASRSQDVLPSSSIPRRGLYNWVFGGAAAAAYLLSTFGSYQYMTSRAPSSSQTMVPEDVFSRYNEIAKEFDYEVDSVEMMMGIGWLRSWLTRKASGNVLEVSAGTGRNSGYYNVQKCKTITLLDQSQEMMDIAQRKFRDAHPKYKACRFVVQSALDPIDAPSGKFDTILQTMGLCSTANPVQTLQHLGTLVNADSGRILLLEHGRSHYDWLNRLLDNSAPSHADKFGCWWNKNIGQIVEQSGLEVVRMKRYHFGTTWWFELKRRRD